MDLVQSKPVEGDAIFAVIREKLHPMMAKRGHPMIEETGSASWQYGAGYDKTLRRKTLFKLLNLPSAILFAIRVEFLNELPNLAALPWPHHIAVKPHRDVEFKGFEIKREDQDTGIARVERILKTLPNFGVEIRLKSDEAARDAEFDRLLGELG